VDDTSDNRLFPIQGYCDEFVTGTCANGRQVVMGLLCPHLVAYFFDPNGELLCDELRPWDTPAPRMGPDGPYQIYDAAFQDALAEQKHEWQKELGFRASTIRVRPFLDSRHPVGISPLPEDLETDECNKLGEDERKHIEELRTEWIARGQFVWWWAKDYYMSKDGAVDST